jgi:hypothetical protein
MTRRSLALALTFSAILPWCALAQTVDEVISRNLEARGGLEKLQAVKSIVMTGKMLDVPLTEDLQPAGPGTEMPVTIQFKRPHSIRMEITLKGQKGVQAYNGEKAWGTRPGSTEPEAFSEEDGGMSAATEMLLKELSDIDSPLLNYKEKWNKVELAGKENVGGAEAYKLKLTPKEGYVRYAYIDSKSYLTTKTTRQNPDFLIETYYGDYKPVQGVMIPHSIENKIDGQTFNRLTLEKADAGAALDDSLFKMPSKAQQ